jgi:hypothetical protein
MLTTISKYISVSSELVIAKLYCNKFLLSGNELYVMIFFAIKLKVTYYINSLM